MTQPESFGSKMLKDLRVLVELVSLRRYLKGGLGSLFMEPYHQCAGRVIRKAGQAADDSTLYVDKAVIVVVHVKT